MPCGISTSVAYRVERDTNGRDVGGMRSAPAPSNTPTPVAPDAIVVRAGSGRQLASDRNTSMPRQLIVIVVLGTVAAACIEGQTDGQRPPELVVLEGATEVREATRNGIRELNYRLEAAYPAEHVTTAISALLQSRGWLPLTEDWLHPGSPSGFMRGWTDYLDGSKMPNTIVHAWVCEWKNETTFRPRFSITSLNSSWPPP